ncbi:MAG: YigZ family protein [Erysipelotrichales bacterium]|nr:YigZ family protein [Erysipelotrichales bacterium]
MPLILSKTGEFLLEEKRSKFLAFCVPVFTEEEALQILNKIRFEHGTASHNCYAYQINGGTIRFSDDGEPQGTAGLPILNVFQKQGIVNFICIITRYYGGIQLGAGGLVRAYTKATIGAIEAAGSEELIIRKEFIVKCNYNNLDKIKYQFAKNNVKILNTVFSNDCELKVSVEENYIENFINNDLYSVEVH